MDVDTVMFPLLARSFFNTCFQKVKKRLSLDFEDDVTARDLIDEALAREPPGIYDRRLTWLREHAELKEAACIIVAPGPTLDEAFDHVFDNPGVDIPGQFIIAVDGAARKFIEKNMKVDVVVTDLDGLTMEQIIVLHDAFFATIIVHSHGNNVDKINSLLETVSLDERYVFTTQIEATSHVANLGGFTDGDRAIFTAIALGFKHVKLLSMDLDAVEIGPYSKLEYEALADDERLLANHPVKEEKIKIALATLKWLAQNKPEDCEITTLCKDPPFDFLPNIDLT